MATRGEVSPELIRLGRRSLGRVRYGRHQDLSQGGLAAALNVGRRTVQDWEYQGGPLYVLWAMVGLLFDRGRNTEAVRLLERHRQLELAPDAENHANVRRALAKAAK